MSSTVHYSVATNFPNGVRLDFLQALIIQSAITVFCSSVNQNGDDIAINFSGVPTSDDLVLLDTIVAGYANPPEDPIGLQTNAPGGDAIKMKAYGDNGGITQQSMWGGITLSTLGIHIAEGGQHAMRGSSGTWLSHGEGYLEDVDFQLGPNDLFLKILVIAPTQNRTITFPEVDDLIAAHWSPARDDALYVYLLNEAASDSGAYVKIAMGTGGVMRGRTEIAPGLNAHVIVRLAGINDDDGHIYTVYRVGV